jgi:hypothetical protein
MRRVLPLIEPTQYDPTLAKFSNYHELWGGSDAHTSIARGGYR